MPSNIRPDDGPWGSNSTPINPTSEKHSWKRQSGKIHSGKTESGKGQPGQNRPTFIRQPALVTLAFLVDTWKRLEDRWEANPGFFAATAAGSVGLLLAAAMLFNAGVGWLQDDPIGDDVAVESPDSSTADDAESDLGEAGSDDLLVMKGRDKTENPFQEDDDDPGIDSDPFAETGMRDKPITRIIVEDPVEDEPDDATEPAFPAENAQAKTAAVKTPSQRPDSLGEDETADDAEPSEREPRQETAAVPRLNSNIFDDEDDPASDEPVAKPALPEMRVASQPEVPLTDRVPAVEINDAEEVASSEADPIAETESDSPPPEPARLKPLSRLDMAQAKEESSPDKPIESARPIDEDDTQLKPKRSIDLVRGPAVKAVPDPRWQQQRTRSTAESPAPLVAARHSSPVETRVFASPAAKSPPPPAKSNQLARANPVVKNNAAPREKSSATQLRLAISGPPAVGIGQPCQIEIRVTNTGSSPAQDLVLSAELPDGLVHEVAQSLEQQIETLAPGATYRARLRLRGQAVGEKNIKIDVCQSEVGRSESSTGEPSTGEKATVTLSSRVRVVPILETATVAGSDECIFLQR